MKGDPLPYSMPGVAEGHVIGWRVWEVKPDATLHSLVASCPWEPGVPVSSRSARPDDSMLVFTAFAELEDGGAGVFALKE